MRLDLHVHSSASDGAFSAQDLVAAALRAGLVALSITDHDSVASVPKALAAADGTPLTVIPGVELSAFLQGRDVHILGYYIDHTDTHLLETLDSLRDARLERARAMLRALAADGLHLSIDDVLAAAEGGSVGRSHVARALVERGHVADVPEAFERYIGRGRPYYVPKPVAEPVHVIATIHDAGGVAVLAHPGVTEIDQHIPAMAAAGLDGLEAYHAEHDVRQRDRYRNLALRLGLIVTGGSDHHGPGAPGAQVGGADVPDSVLDALRERAKLVRPCP